MKKALIHNNKIVQVESESFEVHPNFTWVDCPDDCDTSWSYDGSECKPIEITLDELKAAKKTENASKRYAKETSGVYYNEYFLLTERGDVNIMNATMEKIRRGLVETIEWKCGNGLYFTLTLSNIDEIELLILTHIQTSFATEKVYNEAIEAATTSEELKAIELIY